MLCNNFKLDRFSTNYVVMFNMINKNRAKLVVSFFITQFKDYILYIRLFLSQWGDQYHKPDI